MTKYFSLSLIVLCVVFLWSCSSDRETGEATPDAPEAHHSNPTTGGIPWFDGSIEDAFASAKRVNKPILLYWGAEWCPPCHELKVTIFQRSEFIEQSKLFIPVYLDGDNERAQKYGEKFDVYGYPTVIIFDPQGVEITRIPGGMNIEQYISVLELTLNALHPVSDLVRSVRAGNTIRDDDWRLLASYSWGQDRGKALGSDNKHAVLRTLANGCPDRLTLSKSKLQMLAIDAWAREEEREELLAPEYLAQIDSILNDESLRWENLNSFIFDGAHMLSALPDKNERPELRERILKQLSAVIENPTLDVLTRIDALYGWVEVNKVGLSEDEQISASQQSWVKEQATAAKAQLSSHQQHTALNSLWQLYFEAGLEDDARAILHEGITVSKQPYYFMADMGYLEKKSGNAAEAINWYKKSWEVARGPATRIQWGTNYMFALIELQPDDLAEIGAAGSMLLVELEQQQDGLYHRSRGRMDRLSQKLLDWAEPAEGDSTTGAQRRALLDTLRDKMDRLCEGFETESEAYNSCENFLDT